jgi:Dockerin type I domain
VPTAFNLIAPANDSQTTNLLPTFAWSPSAAGDLYDTVRYSFIIAIDSTFSLADTAKGLTDTVLTLTDSLGFGHNYSWKVLALDKFGGVTQSGQVFRLTTWLPGDANSDGRVDVGDVITIINYVFRGGTPPDPLKVGDANGDCSTNVGDAVYLIKFIFSSGPPPVPGCA